MKMGIDKKPYDAGKTSPVNRWISESARSMLERDEVLQDTSGSTQLPLGGGQTAFGFYSMSVQLGTPTQDLTVLMDTGSSDLAVNLVRRRLRRRR